MTTRVLHVFPESVLEPGQEHLGSTKDIRGRTQYFRERALDVTELPHHRSATGLLQAVGSQDLGRFDAVVLEFPLSARLARHFRRGSRPLLLMRSANAEPLHRLDWMRAMGPGVASAKLAARTVQTTAAEWLTAWRSDRVLSISSWEVASYWPRLGLRSRTDWLPYYVPDDYLGELLPDDRPRENICVCLTSTKRNPVIEDSVRGFRQVVESLPEDNGWRFVVTGDVPEIRSSRLEQIGTVSSPGDLLRTSRAVALLSDYGYGFKTKLLDAVVAGNRVIVTPGLRGRIPPEMAPWTSTVDVRRPETFRRALDEASTPPPDGHPNDELRRRHHGVLDDILGLSSRPPGQA